MISKALMLHWQNRNVLLEIIPFLVSHTREGGIICLCGLLDKDEDSIRDKIEKLPVQISDVKTEKQDEDWILIQLLKAKV